MPALLFLLKGGLIVTLLRQFLMFLWNRHLYLSIRDDADARGVRISDIRKPRKKEKQNPAFEIDANHVNDAGDWIYDRIVKAKTTSTKMVTTYWVRVVLNKEGVSKSEWKQIA